MSNCGGDEVSLVEEICLVETENEEIIVEITEPEEYIIIEVIEGTQGPAGSADTDVRDVSGPVMGITTDGHVRCIGDTTYQLLPSVVGRFINFKLIGTGTLTILPAIGEDLEGQSSAQITNAGDTMSFRGRLQGWDLW